MSITSIAVIVVLAIVLLSVFMYLVPVNLWFQCVLNSVRISLIQLVLMRWRKIPPTIIVNAMINSKKAGLELKSNELEAHYQRLLFRNARLHQILRFAHIFPVALVLTPYHLQQLPWLHNKLYIRSLPMQMVN